MHSINDILDYDIEQELQNIVVRMHGTNFSQDRIILQDAIKILAHYRELRNKGLLMELPVPSGSTVFSVECGDIYTEYVLAFELDEEGLWAHNSFGGIIGKWGETVFATEEEAEVARQRIFGPKENEREDER